MTRRGILINYDYCTGCHSCEVACRVEHGYPDDQGGVIVRQIGPWEYATDRYQYSFMPIITEQCDQCRGRIEQDKDPMCVHHCQSFVMKYGDVDELSDSVSDCSKHVLYYL